MRTTLKHDKALESYSKRKRILIKEFAAVFNQKDRNLIAHYILNKTAVDLGEEIFKALDKLKMLEAYEDTIEERSKQSTPFQETIAKDFMKMCIVEKNYKENLDLQEKNEYHEIAEALDLLDPFELESWIDSLIKWTRQQDLNSLKAIHAYKRSGQELEIEILNKGRELIESGHHLEVYGLDIDHLHVDIQSDLWDVICLIAKYRVEAIIEFYPNIFDPFCRFFIYIVLNSRDDRFQVGLSYIKSSEASLVWLGFKLCLEFLKQLEELYASSEIGHHLRKDAIISRRKNRLQTSYLCVLNEVFATNQIKTIADFELILKHFDIGRKKLKTYKIIDLENIDYDVFMDASINWMLAHPEEICSLPKMTSPYDIELRLRWVGAFLASNGVVTNQIEEIINNYFEFFLMQIRDKNHRYWFQIKDDYTAKIINSWISFFSGVLKYKQWAEVWPKVEKEMLQIKWNESNTWKPSGTQFATDDLLSYCVIIFLHQSSIVIDASKINEILAPLKNVAITNHTTKNNWDILLRFLIPYQKVPAVKQFIETVILKDGVPPNVVSLLPIEMLQSDPELIIKAKEQISSYKNFFNIEYENCKSELELKGLL